MLVLPIAATSFKHPLLLSCHLSPCHWESLLEEPSAVSLIQLIQCWQWALLERRMVTFFPKETFKATPAQGHAQGFPCRKIFHSQASHHPVPTPRLFSSSNPSHLSGISNESSYLPSKALGKAALPVSNYNS